MNYEEFTKRVEHNSRVLKTAIENGTNLVAISSEFYTFQSKPGELHFSI